jgi:hypothetical protein
MEVALFIGGTLFGVVLGLVAGFGSAMGRIEQARHEGFITAFSSFAEAAQKSMEEQKAKGAGFTSSHKKTN